MHLHPRAQTMYLNANGKHIQTVDIRTGLLLQTYAINANTFDDIQIRFNISPCGTFLLTTSATELIGWNVLAGGTSAATFRLPLKHSHVRRQLSSIDYHPNSDLVSVTVYGLHGEPGLYLLCHETTVQQPQNTNKASAAAQQESSNSTEKCVRNKSIENQDLNQIIKRIDDIFSLPQNKTDDVKATGVRSKIPVPLPRNLFNTAATATADIASSMDEPSEGTFTLHKSDDGGNRTFSVHEQNNSGTYNVQEHEQQGDSDDTTISESL